MILKASRRRDLVNILRAGLRWIVEIFSLLVVCASVDEYDLTLS